MNAPVWSSIALSVLGHAVLACWLATASSRMAVPRPWIEVQLFSAGELNGMGSAKASEAPSGPGGHDEEGGAANLDAPSSETRIEPEKVRVENVVPPAELQEVPAREAVLPTAPAVAAPIPKPTPKPRKVRIAAVKPIATPPVKNEAAAKTAPKDAESDGATQGEAARRDTGASGGSPPGGIESEGAGRGGQTHGNTLTEARFGSAGGPDFLKRAQPRYPRIARETGKQGTVLLRVTIDEQGRPVEVEVLDRAGCGFDEEAVQAVKNSVFTPAKRDGRPIACRALLPVRFVLRNPG